MQFLDLLGFSGLGGGFSAEREVLEKTGVCPVLPLLLLGSLLDSSLVVPKPLSSEVPFFWFILI